LKRKQRLSVIFIVKKRGNPLAYSLDEEQLKEIPIENLIESFEFQNSSEPPNIRIGTGNTVGTVS